MIDRRARRPTRFMSSPWPAIPTTSVANSSGTINDLIIRKNTDDRTFKSVAAQPPCASRADSGNAHPRAIPTTIEMMIHCESVMRRRNDLGLGWPLLDATAAVGNILRPYVVVSVSTVGAH